MPMIDAALDLWSSPGLQPCDRCERILPCEWFGSFWLCEPCTERAEAALGLEAAGRGIERLALLHKRMKELERQLSTLVLLSSLDQVGKGAA